MVKAWRRGRMVLGTMVNTYKARSTEKENSLGLTEARIMENSSKITFKEKESIIGPTVVSMTGSGKIIRWKATASSRGQMVVVMKVPMLMTRKKIKDSTELAIVLSEVSINVNRN